MLASAADARMLGAYVQSTVSAVCMPGQHSVAPAASGLTALCMATLLGHCLYSWGSMQGGVYQCMAMWICVELAYYAWCHRRCAQLTPDPSPFVL
jgi:hypothetical protein